MKVKCTNCQTVLKIDEAKFTTTPLLIACPNCQQKMRVNELVTPTLTNQIPGEIISKEDKTTELLPAPTNDNTDEEKAKMERLKSELETSKLEFERQKLEFEKQKFEEQRAGLKSQEGISSKVNAHSYGENTFPIPLWAGWLINTLAWILFLLTHNNGVEIAMAIICIGCVYVGYRHYKMKSEPPLELPLLKPNYLIYFSIFDAIWMLYWGLMV